MDSPPSYYHEHTHIHVHHHGSADGDDDESYPPPSRSYDEPPPSDYYESRDIGYDPPPSDYYESRGGPDFGYDQPPSNDYGPPSGDYGYAPPTGGNPELDNVPSVRVFTKAEPNFSLSIRHGTVVLAPSDPCDPHQHWIKDERYSTIVKDEQGFPSFALVNKATGEAMKHSIGATHPVQLIPYNPSLVDESILWSEGVDLGDCYRAIRMVNNIRLNVDAFRGDRDSGGVHDGSTIVLWEWLKQDNQLWKIVPY